MSAPASVPQSPVSSTNAPARLHLPYLDGIRGLMALYVVHHHILQRMSWQRGTGKMPVVAREIINLFAYGHYAVVVFIVLSGYCLMLPVVRSGGELRGGFRHYIARRARRILPPYYFSLAFTALVLALPVIAHLADRSHFGPLVWWISHLFLVHNLAHSTAYAPNVALWSIATEWQIYFFFPLLLLPLWRRFGNRVVIALASVLGWAAWLKFPTLRAACPWLLGCFAMGMAGAAINFSPRYEALCARAFWKKLAFFGFAGGYLLGRFANWPGIESARKALLFLPLVDLIFGLATMALVIVCTRATLENRPSSAVRFFTARPLLSIGAFSYSLYLIHDPMMTLFVTLVSALHWPRLAIYGATLLVCVPLCVLVAQVFYRFCEKPFLRPAQTAA